MQTAIDVEVGLVMRRIRFAFTERKRRTVSQAEFGTTLGAAVGGRPYLQATVSAWEKGETPVPAAVLVTALKQLSELVGRQVCYEDLLPQGSRNLTSPYLPVAA